MACNTNLTANISTCGTNAVKGLRYKAWAVNRSEIASRTKTLNVISTLVLAATKVAFTIEGFKDFINAGFDAVVSDTMVTKFTHFFSINAFYATAAEKANIDKADDVVWIVERNGAKDASSFIVLGMENGTWKTSQTKRANDNSANTATEFATREGMEEEYSEYLFDLGTGYADNLAYLEGLETA